MPETIAKIINGIMIMPNTPPSSEHSAKSAVVHHMATALALHHMHIIMNIVAERISHTAIAWIKKFLKTPQMEIPATSDHLHAIHEFSEELKEAAGATSLYNESLGTTSDRYVYDRVKGRE